MIKSEIEMIGIINKRGRMIDLIGFDSLNMSKAKKEMFLMKIALRSSMQSDFDDDLGKVSYCMTQRGDRKLISIPTLDNNTIFAVIKNNCDHEELVNDIILTLKDSGPSFGEILFKVGES